MSAFPGPTCSLLDFPGFFAPPYRPVGSRRKGALIPQSVCRKRPVAIGSPCGTPDAEAARPLTRLHRRLAACSVGAGSAGEHGGPASSGRGRAGGIVIGRGCRNAISRMVIPMRSTSVSLLPARNASLICCAMSCATATSRAKPASDRRTGSLGRLIAAAAASPAPGCDPATRPKGPRSTGAR